MQIIFTAEAQTQIELSMAENPNDGPATLKLAYDSEGCGCAVNGVSALWLVEGPSSDDVESDGSSMRVLYDKKHEVFFDDAVTVDYNPSKRSYILKSKQQIYNSMMRLIDKR